MVQSQVLFEQAAAFEGLFQPHNQCIVIKGFGDEIIGAAFHGLHGHLDVPVGGHHHHRNLFAAIGFNLFQNLESADARHFDICQDQVVVAGTQHFQGRFARGCGIYLTTQVGLQAAFQQGEHVRFVVNDKKILCHGLSP